MENLVTMIIVLLIANAIIGFRFALFSNMDKKMVILSLVMVNLVLGGVLIVQQKGIENMNKTGLIVVGIIVAIFMFLVYYNHYNKK